jgi:hypothetical protein
LSKSSITFERYARECSVLVPIRPLTASTALPSTLLFFDVETACGFLNDMSITLAELLYCCTLSSARLVGQVEENIQFFWALKCQMESIVGAKSIWLQRIFIAIGLRISQQNPVSW